ncbi:putative cytoplasmic phosphatidylinositol transfer protein 1 [Scophthalmus maximus]|uniref:Cytoplasmic phosphatidylinositol transfer protein 1 n=1 Tax=Scophthalmus maximus TaxID=52904 RepID=A0A2U9BQJ2_SCOMX|nr:putative cytoplasmic phosphatidylinositol transfer protein 1 [Scophthalmus maximus]
MSDRTAIGITLLSLRPNWPLKTLLSITTAIPTPTKLRICSHIGDFSWKYWVDGAGHGEQYRIGQLYMISKHSHEQSDRGEGVEVVQNEPFEDPTHGQGQFTEKRVYLNSKLPSWARAVVPKIFYVTEKAWNYYPYTITEYTCSFLPKFSIHIETKYEDNKGCNDNIFDTELKEQEREVCFIDIAYDEIPERYYKDSEDLRYFKSEKTSRGRLQEGWRDSQDPIMCSYKLVTVKFEVWGLQTRVEQFVHKVVRDVLLLGHRQAFAWVDEWIDMTMDEVREFERTIQEATNQKIGMFPPSISISETPLSSRALNGPASAPSTPMCTDAPESLSVPKDRPRKKSAPETLTLPDPVPSGVPQGSTSSPLPVSNHLQSSTPPSSNSDLAEIDEQ